MQLETLILSEAQTKIFVMAHDVTETDLHTVIEDFFQSLGTAFFSQVVGQLGFSRKSQ